MCTFERQAKDKRKNKNKSVELYNVRNHGLQNDIHIVSSTIAYHLLWTNEKAEAHQAQWELEFCRIFIFILKR